MLSRPTERGDDPVAPGVPWPLVATVLITAAFAVAGWPGWWSSEPGARLAGPVGEALATMEVASLLIWRRWPLGCFAVAEAAVVTYGVAGYVPTPAGYAGLIATGVGAWGARRLTARYLVLVVAGGGILVIGLARSWPARGADVLANLLLVVVAWFAGLAVRFHEDSLVSRASLAEERSRRERFEDRLALVGALHDRIGRSLIGALRELEAAQVVRSTSAVDGEALVVRATERVRGTLGAVSDLVVSQHRLSRPVAPGSERPRPRPEPIVEPPGLLGAAVWQWVGLLASSGMSVNLSVRGDTAGLPSLVEVAVAGLLAEALANVAAHSAAAEVGVTLHFTRCGATVSIRDPGPGRRGSAGSGHGLERQSQCLARLGGHLQAGPDPDGGFSVQGDIPITAPTSAAP